MANEVKWIKFSRDFFKTEDAWYLEDKNPLFIIYYMKMILYCKQVESENYGYISLVLGNITCKPYEIAMFINEDEETFKEFLELAQKVNIVEVEEKRVKVIFPWDGEPTRASAEYARWKNAVLERDNYTCQVCGRTDEVITHHIIPWRICKDDDDLRYDVDNGICLCPKCHFKTHNKNWRGY